MHDYEIITSIDDFTVDAQCTRTLCVHGKIVDRCDDFIIMKCDIRNATVYGVQCTPYTVALRWWPDFYEYSARLCVVQTHKYVVQCACVCMQRDVVGFAYLSN